MLLIFDTYWRIWAQDMSENALNCLCPSLEMISEAEPCLRILLHWRLENLIVYLTYNRSILQYPILRINLDDLWTAVFTIQVNYFAIWATFREYFIAISPTGYIVKRLAGGFFLIHTLNTICYWHEWRNGLDAWQNEWRKLGYTAATSPLLGIEWLCAHFQASSSTSLRVLRLPSI